MRQNNENHIGAQTVQIVEPSRNLLEPIVLINCGEFSLILRSKNIVTIMAGQKLLPSSAAQACGEVEVDQLRIPVFAFNKALQLQSTLAATQMTVVVLQYKSHLFAICCSELEKLNATDLHFHKVPLSMSNRKQPFTEFSIVNHVAAGFSSPEHLWQLLSFRNAVHAMPIVKNPILVKGVG